MRLLALLGVLGLCVIMLAACDSSTAMPDAGTLDAGTLDAARRDATMLDGSMQDAAEPRDAGPDAPPIRPSRLCLTMEDNHRVLTFGIEQTGDAPPIRHFGDVTDMRSPGSTAVDPVTNEIFVTDRYFDAVHVYSRTADGNVAPLRTIRGASTGLDEPFALAISASELFVLNIVSNSVTVYARTASGDAAPLRTLTDLGTSYGIAFDGAHDELFVAATIARVVKVFARTASGAATPLRTLSGAATGLGSGPYSVTVDAVNDEILVSTAAPALLAFARTASGDTAPLRTMSLSASSFSVDVDTTNDEVWVAYDSAAHAFARTATGAPSPLRSTPTVIDSAMSAAVNATHGEVVLIGSSGEIGTYDRSTGALRRMISRYPSGLNSPGGLGLDAERGELWVGNNENPSMNLFPLTSNGASVMPLRTIGGPTTGILGNARALAVDSTRGEIFVGNDYPTDNVSVFSRDANGDVAPLRSIGGAATMLYAPDAIVLAGDELFVATSGAVLVFARDASGDVAPLRALGIPAATIGPSSIFADTARNELAVTYFTNSGGEIAIYDLTASGTASPLRTLSGPATRMTRAGRIIVHPTLEEMWVAHEDSIFVFPHDASGDVAPARTINGPATRLGMQPQTLIWCD